MWKILFPPLKFQKLAFDGSEEKGIMLKECDFFKFYFNRKNFFVFETKSTIGKFLRVPGEKN